MKKGAILVLAAVVTLSVTSEAKSLSDAYRPPKMLRQEAPAETTDDQEEIVYEGVPTEEQGYQGNDPIAGRNLMSVFLTDLINVVTAPGATSFVALFFDLFNFIFMPIIGGLMMSSVTYNYDLDATTYRNANLSKADMYASQMRLIKTSLYAIIGKKNFFEGDDAAYVPPNEAVF